MSIKREKPTSNLSVTTSFAVLTGDDGSKLPRRSRDTVSGGSVSRGEDFSRNDERRGVWSKILLSARIQELTHLEEVRHAVQEYESFFAGRSRLHGVVAEAHADEDDREHDKAH